MLKPIAILVLVPLTLAACGPSPEARAQAERRRKEECLNKICQGDLQPKFDFKTEALFKRNGRWFIAPKEYGGFDGSFAFFWPSKIPARTIRAAKEAPEFTPSAAGQNSNFYKVAIEFFVESGSNVGETYGFIEQAIARKSIVRQSN